MNDQTAQDSQQSTNVSYVDDYVPPTQNSVTNDSANTNITPVIVEDDSSSDDSSGEDFMGNNPNDEAGSDEDLEALNIFYMLGVDDGDDDLKERFLDQLQEVIWDDFINNDLELLLSEDEKTEFQTYKSKVDSTSDEAQETAKDEMVDYLEKLLPDLEEIMLEKALDLKADLFVERINSLKEYFTDNSEKLNKVNEAEQLMQDDKWKSATEILNSIEE
jgi:hypothetical protein